MYVTDYLFLALLVVFLASLYAQYRVNATFQKYSRLLCSRGISAADAAQAILTANGVTGVSIEQISGNLTDHYDPRSNTIRLSSPVYGSTSVSAIGVAAHEAGHAVQYARHYLPVKIRTAILPAVQFGSNACMILILLGLVFSFPLLSYLGCAFFGLTTLFQFVTLPVEFDASRRALKMLTEGGYTTYLAAFAMSLLQFLRLFALVGRRRR